MIHTANFEYNGDNFGILRWIRARIAHFEDKYLKLKEITTILELALWKTRLDENVHKRETNRCKKKIRSEESDIRRQCHAICGVDIVIGHVLPFLITAVDE